MDATAVEPVATVKAVAAAEEMVVRAAEAAVEVVAEAKVAKMVATGVAGPERRPLPRNDGLHTRQRREAAHCDRALLAFDFFSFAADNFRSNSWCPC